MRAPRRRVASAVKSTVVAVVIAVAAVAGQEAPLPDAEAFLVATRENLARAAQVQDRFAYKERRTELHMNPFGRLGTGGVRVQQVTPLAGQPGMFERRLLERDGKPVTDSKAERFERRRRSQGRSSIEDAASALTVTIDGREHIDGRDVIVVRFKCQTRARPQTREGRLATVLEGRSGSTNRRARSCVPSDAIDDVSYGFGMIAKLRKGASMSLTRAPATGQVWLPTSVRFSGDGSRHAVPQADGEARDRVVRLLVAPGVLIVLGPRFIPLFSRWSRCRRSRCRRCRVVIQVIDGVDAAAAALLESGRALVFLLRALLPRSRLGGAGARSWRAIAAARRAAASAGRSRLVAGRRSRRPAGLLKPPPPGSGLKPPPVPPPLKPPAERDRPVGDPRGPAPR